MRPYITFWVNLLARYSSSLRKRYLNGVKQILRYLRGTIDMSLFYSNKSNFDLVDYADAEYLSNPHKLRSQTGYLFTCGGTAITWRSIKQTITTTSSNHAEILAIRYVYGWGQWLIIFKKHVVCLSLKIYQQYYLKTIPHV